MPATELPQSRPLSKAANISRAIHLKNKVATLAGRSAPSVAHLLLKLVPKNRYGDHFFAFLKFVKRHKRLPTRKLLFNDVLYRIKTTNEILDPLRVFVSDKEFLKLYVKAVVGDQYNVPTIDIIRNYSTIDNYHFPANCCIKPTHASKRVILRTDASPIDRDKIKKWADLNYYTILREANYKMLTPKIIVEPLIFGKKNIEDYKIFCYKGTPKIIQVDVDRYINHKQKIFDSDWNELSFTIKYPRSEKIIPKPDVLEEMLEVAAKISKPFSFIRVDLYSEGNEILVGELTNISANAGSWFVPLASEDEASRLIFGEE